MKKSFHIITILILLFALKQSFYLEAKAYLAQHLISQAWSETTKTLRPTKPWSWADTWPVLKLSFPGGEQQYVLNSTSGQAMAFGPGHMLNSGYPGEGQDIVLSAHRDTHFNLLQHLKVGETIRLTDTTNISYAFTVTQYEIVDSSSTSLQIETNGERLRLITCYPFNSLSTNSPLRYVITALPSNDVKSFLTASST